MTFCHLYFTITKKAKLIHGVSLSIGHIFVLLWRNLKLNFKL